MNMEFYTYSGFDIIVPAFQRIALIFNTGNYQGLFISFAVLGVLFASSAATIRGFTGHPVALQSWAIPIVLGMTVFQALLIPRASVLITDPVKNESTVVGDVPQAVVLIAGLFNLVERGMVEAVDLASSSVYAEDAEGISFNLLHEAANRSLAVADNYTTKNITFYIKNCAPVALNSPSIPLSEALIKRGTNDLRDALAGMALTSLTTVVFSTTDKAGTPVSCHSAWNNTLLPALQDSQFLTVERELCAAVGFDPDRVAQLDRCRLRMQDAMRQFGVPLGTFSASHFARNYYLAQRFAVAVQGNSDLATLSLANRNTLVEGIGMYEVASEWLPQIRAIMTAIALAMVPILTLFLVTPLASKAAFFVLGLFGWLTLWGVTDAILHDMSMGAAEAFWENTRQLGFALDGIYRSPEASAQALALLGKSKTYSITIASVLAMAIWRFGGYAFSQMTENWSNHLERSGADAALKMETPEGSARTLADMTDSMATHALHNQFGPSAIAQNGFLPRSASINSSNALTEYAGQMGHSLAHMGAAMGARDAGQMVGNLTANRDLTTHRGGDSHRVGDLLATAHHTSQTQGVLDGVNTLSRSDILTKSAGDLATGARRVSDIKNTADVASTAVTQELSEHIQALSDSPTPYRDLATYQNMDTMKTIMASGGDVDRVLNTETAQRSVNLSQSETLTRSAARMGLPPAEVGRALGSAEAASASAKSGALEKLGLTQMAQGQLTALLREGISGENLQHIADEQGLSVEDLLRKVLSTESRQQVADAAITQEMTEQIQTLSDEPVSQQDAYEKLSRFGKSGPYSDVLAASGNDSRVITTGANRKNIELSQTEAFVDAATEAGLSPAAAGKTKGEYEATGVIAQRDAFKTLGSETITQGQKAHLLREGISGETLHQVAQEQGLSVEDLLRNMLGTESRQRVAETNVSQAITDDIQQRTGASVPESFNTAAQYRHASTIASVRASDGDANRVLRTSENEQRQRLAQNEALVKTAQKLGLSPEEMGQALGAFEASGTRAKADALETLSPQQVALGYVANHLRHGYSGDQLNRLAKNHGMGLSDFMESSAGIDAARQMAQVLKTDFVADTFRESPSDAVLRQEGATNTLSLSGKDINRLAHQLAKHDLISPEQRQWLHEKAESGETIQASYALDINAEQAGNVRLFSGHQVIQDHSSTFNDATTVRQGIHADEIATFKAFTQTDADPAAYAVREQIFRDYDQDGTLNDAGTVAALPRLDQALSAFGKSQVSDYDRSSVSGSVSAQVSAGASVNFNTRDNLIGKVVGWLSGASGKGYVAAKTVASTEANGSTGSSEDLSYSNFSVQALDAMTTALQKIDVELDDKGLDLMAKNTLNRNDAEMYRHQRFTELMAPFIQDYIVEMQRVGQHNMEDSDQAEVLQRFKDRVNP